MRSRVFSALLALLVVACSEPAPPLPPPGPDPIGAPSAPFAMKGAAAPATTAATAAAAPATAAPATGAEPAPTIVIELLATAPRAPVLGGSGIVLLADPASALGAARNHALCRALFQSAAAVTPAQEGLVLRPIYWPARSFSIATEGVDRCAARLEAYDWTRAQRIKRKLGLTGEGPYLVVERNDASATERVAAFIDLSRTRAEDAPDVARYFRDSVLQASDVWDARRYAPDAARANIAQFFGRDVSYGRPPRMISAARQVGCPLADVTDRCAE